MYTAKEFELFRDGYITCLLWAETDNSTDQGGDPLDKNFDHSNLTERAKVKIDADCKAFLDQAHELIDAAEVTPPSCHRYEYAGHDFWLTRQGHGCGFWDGDWDEETGEKLTEMCKKMGEVHSLDADLEAMTIDMY